MQQPSPLHPPPMHAAGDDDTTLTHTVPTEFRQAIDRLTNAIAPGRIGHLDDTTIRALVNEYLEGPMKVDQLLYDIQTAVSPNDSWEGLIGVSSHEALAAIRECDAAFPLCTMEGCTARQVLCARTEGGGCGDTCGFCSGGCSVSSTWYGDVYLFHCVNCKQELSSMILEDTEQYVEDDSLMCQWRQ